MNIHFCQAEKLTSILGIRKRDKALAVMDKLAELNYIERMNRFVAWYSKKLLPSASAEPAGEVSENRVALSLYAYISLCKSCKNCSYDCWGDGLRVIPEKSKLHSPRQTQNFGGYGYG